MLVSIVGAKILYGHGRAELSDYLVRVWNEDQSRLHGCVPNDLQFCSMSDSQFVRFKNAGRRHAGGTEKFTGFSKRDRPDRMNKTLDMWDVESYGHLSAKTGGPWGGGLNTNRDHMTANSSNQIRFRDGSWPGTGTSAAQVRAEALAIAISGEHHRKASWTYGSRTRLTDTPTGETRTEFGATSPTASFAIETRAMLQWKSDHLRDGKPKSTLRLEMVGAYVYMYIRAVKFGVISASVTQDQLLMHYLLLALQRDDGQHRVRHPIGLSA